MHRAFGAIAVIGLGGGAGCGDGDGAVRDASVTVDAAEPADAAIDAPACPRVLLTGGMDVGPQGWTVVARPPATLTYGGDFVRLQTMPAAGGSTSGALLLVHPGAVEPGAPFRIQVVMQVETVNPHNQFDAAAAILGSFSMQLGSAPDRSQMIYLDADRLGWADDTQSVVAAATDGAYHTYELSVDASGVARFTRDGVAALTRTGFTTNGAIAVGDQTNDPGVDSALRVRSITRLCP